MGGVQYSAALAAPHSDITVNIIFPATDKHIAKFSAQEYHMVDLKIRTASLLVTCNNVLTVEW